MEIRAEECHQREVICWAATASDAVVRGQEVSGVGKIRDEKGRVERVVPDHG